MAGGKFVKGAARLIRILGKDRCAVAGGMAVNAHGFIRATRDVDVIVTIPLTEAHRRLAEHGVSARLFKGDPREGDFPCLKGIIGVGARGVDAVPFDVLPQLVPFEPSRMVDLTVRGQQLRVIDPDTLMRLKLKAGSPKDLYDIGILVNLHPEWQERAAALAAHDPQLEQRLKAIVEDPRTRAQAKEIKRQDTALSTFARRIANKRIASKKRREPT